MPAPFNADGKFCENELETHGPSASMRRAYTGSFLFPEKKHTDESITCKWDFSGCDRCIARAKPGRTRYDML